MLLLIITFLLWILIGGDYFKPKSEYEEAVNKITEISNTDELDALNQIVKEGMINIQYSTGAIFNGRVSEKFNVRNIKNNHYPLVFELLDKEKRVLYTSDKIEPGYELNKIALETELPKGTHECKIRIGYAEEGNVASEFPITIEVR